MTDRPLAGVSVIELAAIGPAPHACMLLSDLGAEVTRIVRPGKGEAHRGTDHTLRGRSRTVELDLKDTASRDAVLDMVGQADVLVEGMRPGVTERLGLGPDDCWERNPALVYGRMTGWGQSGPFAAMAGHDINYLALSGVLSMLGPAERPMAPLNLVGDYGGGSMVLVTGLLAGLWASARTGRGRVVDAAMIDGIPLLAQLVLEQRSHGRWTGAREANLLDGGAPFYRTYRCADGRFVAVGALEPQFYELLIQGLGLDPASLPSREDRAAWPGLTAALAERFAQRTRDEWATVFDHTDACVTPVLEPEEAARHPHVAARQSVTYDGQAVVAVGAPRFTTAAD